MRVRVTKPRGGKVNLRADDRRGLTGRVWKALDVPIEEVEETIRPFLVEWEELRQGIKNAKEAGSP